METPWDDWANTVVKSVAHFADCIAGKTQPITSAQEGRENMAVLKAAYKLGMDRRPVQLDERF